MALEKDELYQRFQKDLQQSEYFHQPGYVLCPGTVCYLLYVYLLTDNPLYGSLGDDNPEIITRFYGYLLRNPNYQALDQLLREKYQVQPDVSLQMNILELYAETLAGGDRFHLESCLETEANEKMDIYPPLKHAICQDLEHCLNYRVQKPVCRSFALNLQNYYLRHLKLGCRIVIADDSPLLYESVAKLQGYFIGKNDQLISFSPRQNKLSELQTKAPQIICAAPRVFELFRGRDFGPYTELYYIVPNRALYILPKLRKYKYESDRRQLAYELDKILAVD
ncbi:hypothetical protein [Ligilactobacillus equi]|uniref:Uncharacterized protein n=1 Tax=Ligilactobacillus equi DSM 15833 = JCM 10991 TaxID=1423740 RepID=A0A0R1TI39_9LACO|nr:hypothetical protein [Ligilactobacillus equi]KRL79716.1 hypothetical protein FC36_GL000416 [Ligilactobacillus equi DSM 15833 = JCM 10991]